MTSFQTMGQRLEHSAALPFLPYMGPEYNAAALRVLLLGEAAHGPKQAQENRRFIRGEARDALRDSAENVKGNHWLCYARNMEAMFTGQEYGSAPPVRDHLAYGVFFQRIRTGPVDAPSPEDMRRAREAFSALLEILAPRIVTVWGAALPHLRWLPQTALTTAGPPSLSRFSHPGPRRCFGAPTTRPGFQLWPGASTPAQGAATGRGLSARPEQIQAEGISIPGVKGLIPTQARGNKLAFPRFSLLTPSWAALRARVSRRATCNAKVTRRSRLFLIEAFCCSGK